MQDDRIRLAELVGAVSLATDIGMGEPLERALRSTVVAMRLGARAGLDDPTLSQVYYVSLLMFIGCTSDQHTVAEYFGDEHVMNRAVTPLVYASEMRMFRAAMPLLAGGKRGPAAVARIATSMPAMAREMSASSAGHCEVAQMLSERLGVDPATRPSFGAVYEQWNGKGGTKRLKGEDIPIPVRVVALARDAEWQRGIGGVDYAADIVRARAGKTHDPQLAQLLAEHAHDLLGGLAEGSVWDEAMAAEPAPHPVVAGDDIDRALEAVADFVDLKSPFLREHSRGVAALAGSAAERCGFAPSDAVAVRRAGLVHDIGRVAVSAAVWARAGRLSVDDLERVRLHPYHCDRVLARTPLLAQIARVASMHHERLDGSGYHRGAQGNALPPAARILAAADSYRAMIEPRPHREALPAETAAKELRAEADAGRLDSEAVAAVLACAGHRPGRRSERAAGLTDREVEVLRLVARGLPTKQIARRLEISPKTADNHIQNIYAKCGVSTRAAATVFAMDNGLCSEPLG